MNQVEPLFERLALLLRAGIPLLDALDLAAAEESSRTKAAGLRRFRQRLAEGVPLGEAAGGEPSLRPHAVLLGLAEPNGLLDSAFEELAAPVDARARFLRWLTHVGRRLPFGEAFTACVPLLPPADRRAALAAKPSTLREAAERLPAIFPSPLADMMAGGAATDLWPDFLSRVAAALHSRLLPPASAPARLELQRAFASLALLMGAGRPLLEALPAVAGLAGGRTGAAFRDASARVAAGGQLWESLQAHPRVVSPCMTTLLRRAEEAGNLEQALSAIAGGLRSGALRPPR